MARVEKTVEKKLALALVLNFLRQLAAYVQSLAGDKIRCCARAASR
jgi:hypothetical protein